MIIDSGIIDNSQSPNARWRAAGLRSVKWLDGFWRRRFDQIHDVTLPYLWKGMNDASLGHVVQNFRILAGIENGQFEGTNYQDEWAYKWIEAAAYVFLVTGDAGLDRQMDELIALIAQAQAPDGYLSCNILKFKERLVVPRRHELYNMGHLVTAAEHGESVVITRRGKTVARIVPAVQKRRRGFPDLTEFRKSIKIKGRSLTDELLAMRREERY